MFLVTQTKKKGALGLLVLSFTLLFVCPWSKGEKKVWKFSDQLTFAYFLSHNSESTAKEAS
jgi:hypothetical protein